MSGPVLLALLLAASGTRPFAHERQLLDRRLEALRRALPDGPSAAADVALVKELVEAARLLRAEVLARPPLESGASGALVVDVSGLGRFTEIDRFFRQASLSSRPIDVESLGLTATPEDWIRFSAVLRLPFRPPGAPLPPPPEGFEAVLRGVPRRDAELFLRDQALALAKSEALAALRRSRRNPRLFLSELSAVTRDRPVILTQAVLGDEFLVRGLTVGEGPTRSLEARLESGFFRLAEFLVARQGACRRFEARGRSPVAGAEAELPLPAEDPFAQEEAPCKVDRDPDRDVVLAAPAGRPAGKGPLTLRLRGVDLADVFSILHQLTSQGFVVDRDVAGRISLELGRATLEEALAGLHRAGIRISEPAPIRLVSRAVPRRPAADDTASVQPATFALKRAEVRDVLAVMSEIDPALAALGPPGFLGSLSLWVKDTPLRDLRAAVLAAAGLEERTDAEGRRILRRGTAEEELVPVAGGARDRRLVLGARDLSVAEFELAGLASAGNGWTAFAYSPAGVLHAYRAGERLFDGSVASVDSNDVVLETEEGPLRIPIAPLAR